MQPTAAFPLRFWPWYLASVTWLAVMLAGMGALAAYSTSAGEAGQTPASWPGQLGDRPRGWTLALAVHPRCPCTEASIRQLQRTFAMLEPPPSVVAAVYEPPPGEARAEAWPREPDAADRLRSTLGARIVRDPGGEVALAFGGFTSGHAVLFDPEGDARFRGGVTPSRSHTGPNTGTAAIRALLRGERPPAASAPVYGCPLRDRDGCGDACPLSTTVRTDEQE